MTIQAHRFLKPSLNKINIHRFHYRVSPILEKTKYTKSYDTL